MRSQTGLIENPARKLKANTMKRQKVFSLALLLVEVAFTLFIAGIVVPSLLRSESATNEALALGSLRAINIAGFAFSYTTQSVGFAILGAWRAPWPLSLCIFAPLHPEDKHPQEEPFCGLRYCGTETLCHSKSRPFKIGRMGRPKFNATRRPISF